jgi:hypothetical protein
MKNNKQFAIIVLWTLIAVVIGLFLFLRRERPKATPERENRSQSVHARLSEPEPEFKTSAFTLITLNDLLISTETFELIAGNVSVVRKLAEKAERHTGGLIVLFTVPEEMAHEKAENVPQYVKDTIEKRLEEAGLLGGFLKPHRIVYSQTVDGRISIGRQLQAHIFIDPDVHVVSDLTGKVPNVVCVNAVSLKAYVDSQSFFPYETNS